MKVVYLVLIASSFLLNSAYAEPKGCPHVCQNGGLCVPRNGSYECQCPCGKTGDTCQATNWCPDVKFSKVGCLPATGTKPAYLAFEPAKHTLEEFACLCANHTRQYGLKYFALGDDDCVGYNENEISVENLSPQECRQADQMNCNSNTSLPACYGRAGFQFVYALSLADQYSCEEDIRDCSDYDYVYRQQDDNANMYFGPIEKALPSGKPFSYCMWIRLAFRQESDRYFVYAYSSNRYGNQFTLNYYATSVDANDFYAHLMTDELSSGRVFSIPGGIFNKWRHVCDTINLDTKTVTTYIHGSLVGSFTSNNLRSPVENGRLIIGRDQDSFGGRFGTGDVVFGDVASFNVWDYLISDKEIEQIYSGPGTVRGNFLAWVDMKKYVSGLSLTLRDNPVLKWKGGGCRWERTECDEESGLCKGGIFRCPCSKDLTAPRSCFSSDIYEMKPCSEHNYYLEYPSTETGARITINDFVLYNTWFFTVCLWIKYPPGSSYYHGVIYIGTKSLSFANFFLFLHHDQKRIVVRNNNNIAAVECCNDGTYANNEWFHVCAVQDHQTLRLYKNGVLKGSRTHSGIVTIDGHNEIYIGDHPTQANKRWSFLGSMAHLNIWVDALSDSTIASIANEGNTYVGNLFAWPDLAKYAIPGVINIRRPSPVMRWSDKNCHWSKDTCAAEQLCQNAKYICPSSQLGEAAPQSCSTASYTFTNADKKLKPNLLVDLMIVSRDSKTLANVGLTYSSVFVNDLEHKVSGSHWMQFFVLDAITGFLLNQFGCSTFHNSTCSAGLEDALSKVGAERIMIMVVNENPDVGFGSAIPAIHSAFGHELHVTNSLSSGQSFSLLGYSGSNDVSWRESRILAASQGPSIIRSTVPLLRESCLDHMYMGERENGKYTVYPPGGKEMMVYCDFTTNGGGWTVIQRRNQGNTLFPSSEEAYNNGFGPVDGEFWLGNKKIHRLGRGQMLAVVYENSTSSFYDLYNDFYVMHNSMLDISDRSGTLPAGILNTDSVGPLVFVSSKASKHPSDCLKSLDGGWWFRGNCDGENLNAEKRECGGKSWLGTEMLFRPRESSNDVVIKEISPAMTYQDGMDACLSEGLRLCSSMEICRDGKHVSGGSVRNTHWAPVADYYNRWINTGSLDKMKICEIKKNPGWGTESTSSDDKGKVYCCKNYAKKAVVAVNESKAIIVNLPDTYSYTTAVENCKKKGLKLCSQKEICPDGSNLIYGSQDGYSKWAPISDQDNGWLQMCSAHRADVCESHFEEYQYNPTWGLSPEPGSWKGHVFCCLSDSGPWLPSKYTIPDTSSYMDGMDFCAERKQRLCTKEEICPLGQNPSHGEYDSQMWARILDRNNDWVSIGTQKPICKDHTDLSIPKPTWGENDSPNVVKSVLFCCPLIMEGRIARTWKYDIKFHGNLSYVRFPKLTPLSNSSVCWWMLLSVQINEWKTVFSYQTLDTNDQIEFAVLSDTRFRLTVGGKERFSSFSTYFVDNPEYHHICILWSWLARKAKIYRDGHLISTFDNLPFPKSQKHGSLVIGQSYKESSSSFNPDKSFIGVITRFNIWDHELDGDAIGNASVVCGEDEGNIIAWPEVKLWAFDGVEVTDGDDCFPESCLEYFHRGKQSGLYEIRPAKNQPSIQVYCDQDTGSGGWVEIGYRAENEVNFPDKNFQEYRDGFGDLESNDFWLGHERIHRLTSAQTHSSLLTIKNEYSRMFPVSYQWFMLGRPESAYPVYFSNTFGARNYLLNDKPFVTADKDLTFFCGSTYGPFWHDLSSGCHVYGNLFGKQHTSDSKGAQWSGVGTGKLEYWWWNIRPSHTLKSRKPVVYWTDVDITWKTAKEFCQRKDADLCTSSALCNSGNRPFGGMFKTDKKTPILDSFGKWINLGTDPCAVVSPPDGNTNDVSSYKSRVICCRGYAKRDWRYDLRFKGNQSEKMRSISLPPMNSFTICFWLRTTPFSEAYVTVFTIRFGTQYRMLFSVKNDGSLVGRFPPVLAAWEWFSSLDGKWHHYCLREDGYHIDVFADGEYLFHFFDNGHVSNKDNGMLFIGHEVTMSGEVVQGSRLIGDLSRFNIWIKKYSADEIKEMAKKCGSETGDIVAWPEIKYYIEKHVEYDATTCVKPERHFWPFNEIDGGENAYKDVLNEYNLRAPSGGPPIEAGGVMNVGNNGQYAELNIIDDCLTDPEICRKTGFTIGLWLRREGLQSKILPESDLHYPTLLKWLDTAAFDISDWLLCYHHAGPGMDTDDFHERCDYVGATLTLVRVGENVFGGFSNENWGGSSRHLASHSSFLFSIYNPSHIAPVKLEIKSGQSAFALYIDSGLGPTFGNNFDLKIASPESSSTLGQTYNLPPGITDASFFTSTDVFTVDQIEVFYAHVPSEAVGIEFPSVIKDDQITASFSETPTFARKYARLHSTGRWLPLRTDPSPWIQIKLNGVARIKEIATQGCVGNRVKTFKLFFSMDGSYWTSYKENFTEKILTGNTDEETVKKTTLQYAVDTKFVKISFVEKEGNYGCIRIELYETVQVCPSTSNGAVACPGVSPGISEVNCTNLGCCFLNTKCFSKQETFRDLGMQSGVIPDTSITVSSVYKDFRPNKARFMTDHQGWRSSESGTPQWLQVKLNQDETLTHIATLGSITNREYSYCKSYKLHHGKSSDAFVVYTENGQPRVFVGYNDTRKIKNVFLKPFIARFVRLYPESIPTGLTRIELYRALRGTNILSTSIYTTKDPRGIFLEQHTLMQYRFAVQADRAVWEVFWEWQTHEWTHLAFTWSEKAGIKVYENADFKMAAKEPSRFTEAKYLRISDKFMIGKKSNLTVSHKFRMANLFVLKRFTPPLEYKSMIYGVSCGFDDTSQSMWKNMNWTMTDSSTPSNHTGPDEGVQKKDFNLAWGSRTALSGSSEGNSSFLVDGFLETCALVQPAETLSIRFDEPKKVKLVVVFFKRGYDHQKLAKYKVSASTASCAELDGFNTEFETGKSFYCEHESFVDIVNIMNLDVDPLTLCEVAVYNMTREKFAYMESSYPAAKGFSGFLTTTIFGLYNCLHFSYHMHGENMGRLNVFGPGMDNQNRTLLWRIVGDQGKEWKQGVVKLEKNKLQDFHEIMFEAVVGDGYTSDIALDNVVFTVDSQCYTYPSVAKPTISVISPKRECSCLSVARDGSHVTITTCTALSQSIEWQSDGILKIQEKCLRPVTDDVIEGTKVVLSTSCSPSEDAFRITPTGSIQHVRSLLCIQAAEGWNGLKVGDILALGREGCSEVRWHWTTILLKVSGVNYSKLNVLKLGTSSISCGDYDGTVMRFTPVQIKSTLPGASVVTYNDKTSAYSAGSVVEVHENTSSLVVSLGETERILVSANHTSITPNQPLSGSSILGTMTTPKRLLSEWLGSRGIFSEFWRPCVYLTNEGVANFNCTLNGDVPKLLLIRKERVLIGGCMDHSNSNRSFLFSLKESSSSIFNQTSSNGGVVLTDEGMTFANDELSITWVGEPIVKNVLGRVFRVDHLDSMAGVGQFTADDFEVLQPHDEVCVPGCKSKDVCDQITGKCICDSTGRPPSWCSIGASPNTIYADTAYHWSLDSKHNILKESGSEYAWALVQANLSSNIGVNGPGIEIKNDGKVELISNDKCFRRSDVCGKLALSFWFKSIETEKSSSADRMFLQTSYDILGHSGLFMYSGGSPGEILFEKRGVISQCIHTFHIEPNLWTFVAFVFGLQTKSWHIYLNGVKLTTDVTKVCSSAARVKNPVGKLILGNGGKDSSAVFDDVAVWYRALEDTEIETIYRYYYKDPRVLIASLDVNLTNFVWGSEPVNKEPKMWKSLENEIHTKFASVFPGFQNTSFVIDECRKEPVSMMCKLKLTLNGSDYEMVEILEDKNVIPDMKISNITTYQVPFQATFPNVTSPEASKIILEWNPEEFSHLYQGFLITATNNKTNETTNVTENAMGSPYELNNMTGYSYYIIRFAVYTLAGIGKWSEVVIKTMEDVPKYPPSNLTGHNASSTTLNLNWNPVPIENTYKELRGYIVYVIETSTSISVKNITTDSSTHEVLIDDLKKFRTYTLYIRALSIDVGVKSITMNLTTAEDAPDSPPDDVKVFNSSSRSVRIEFKPVPPDLINGILRGYRVFYWKTREGSLHRKNFTLPKEPEAGKVTFKRRRRSVSQYHQGYPLFADIYNLNEYTNYTVQIQAITILDGVLSPPYTTLTSEDLPSMAPPNVTARNSSSTSILLEWDMIPEGDRNGIILGYNIYYTGRSGVEQKYVHNSTYESISLDLKHLEKYTEYSFELTVFNSIGESNRSVLVSCKTDQDRPDLPPQDIAGMPTSPSTMGVVWKPVPFPYERGIILGYHFVFTTVTGDVMVDKILGPNEHFISVSDLHIFTNYTVNMTAFTIKGEGPWSSKVVLSLQIAPTIPPLNFTGQSFQNLNKIPVAWIKVPPELTKGYILGYKLYIKLVAIGLEKVPDAREREIVLTGAVSSHVIEGLEYFAEYRIYMIAFTVAGGSPRSNTIYAETCRCGPTLWTQWTNLAPYTNITNAEYFDNKILKNDWGIFPYIVEDAVVSCCQTCRTHNYSTVSFSRNYHGDPAEVTRYEALVNSIDGLTDLTFPVYGYVGMNLYHSLYKYTPLIESPGSAFIVRKEETNMSELLLMNILGNWPLAAVMVCLAFAAGAVMWWFEKSGNSEEFTTSAFRGVLNGFWWAYVTMTTVGYGDRSPKTTLGRLFAITWTLVGLVVTGIMVGNLTSSLTLSVTFTEKIIYGAKVGALDSSPEFRLGVRLNAKMNTVRTYHNLDELYKALLDGEVDGILLDAYVVGSRKDLFKNPKLVVNKLKDYRAAYGIVWAGVSSRMRQCVDWYMKSRKSKMFNHIADNLEMARKIDRIDAQEELSNIFDPTTKIYTTSLFYCLVALASAVGLGFIYEILRRRRLATKIKPHGENEIKNEQVKTMDKCVHKIASEILDLTKETKEKHLKQLKSLRGRGWFKRSSVVVPVNKTQSTESLEVIDL
ncbi:uncharacterized protein LOC114525810 [Dendronephthya gigantea]|uniref:uncharacterized protein LOC114525810 n=1 Tax=Dendronephthya gigantea TaxID=151771 RepID=UPI00106D2840|nr:uncharacterized protein LOC114525810 [Dendronephthya gigantea]XP_028403046.1 uncharacterized protein LOC114525810 [Dendronephthya gigantea]XP_028403047.1 uncharacterized protein LOC114525810 [Dendronephthya gigantea]